MKPRVLCTAFCLVISALRTLPLALSSSFVKEEHTRGFRIGVLCTVFSFSLSWPPLDGTVIRLSHGRYTPAAMWTGTCSSTLVALLALLSGKIDERTAPTWNNSANSS